jgi:molybdenum cofactor cytidylyltransferase
MIAGLILAAGESSRMGEDKALLTYRGRTFIETILATLREAGVTRLAVVLGHHADEIQRAVDFTGVDVIVNRDYRQRQTSSLQAGLKALDRGAGMSLEAVLLCLVDHPAVPAEVVRALVAAFRAARSPVVIPTFKGQRGHPVLIGRTLFGELLGLSPEAGANSVIRKYRESTQFVEVDDAGILVDVDDPASYQKLNQP